MNPYRLPAITTEQVMAEGEAARIHITTHDHLHQNRGYVVEDYLFNGVSKADLCDKYHASYTEIEKILDAYFDENPVKFSFVPTKDGGGFDFEKELEGDSIKDFLKKCEAEFIAKKISEGLTRVEMAEKMGLTRSALQRKIKALASNKVGL